MVSLRALLLALALCSIAVGSLFGANQTETTSPIYSASSLPYRLEIRDVETSGFDLPTLHSFAAAKHDGKWVLLAGRTNGLHGFEQGGLGNFPPQSQNRDVWVIDIQARQSWHRSLEDASSGLTQAQVDSLTPTNNQFAKQGDRLYMTGGYGFSRDSNTFGTFDTLTAIDLSGIIDWVQAGTGSADDHIRQINEPIASVTGGAMLRIGETMHLVFGQDFQGGYNPFRNGTYTRQVRSFEIVDDGNTLAIENVRQTEPLPEYRRRDLNVIPRILRNPQTGELEQGIVALSGVFTETVGAWTVPVEIDAAGTPSMSDPTDPETLRQGFNAYHSAKVGLFSEHTGTMHTILFGGIGLETVDPETGVVVRDNDLPFVNDITSLVIDSDGTYHHHWLGTMPLHEDEFGNRLRFGTNAEFFVHDEIAAFENGVLQLDALDGPTSLGYVFGGIISNAPHTRGVEGAISAASNRVFEVILTPVPEPTSLLATLIVVGTVGIAASGQRVSTSAARKTNNRPSHRNPPAANNRISGEPQRRA